MNESENTYAQSSVKVIQRHRNVDQEIVEITVDKLKLILQAHLLGTEKQNAWKGDLAVFLSLLLTVITADFKNIFAVESGVWRSVFIIGVLVYFAKFVISLVKYFKSKSIDDLISTIKTDNLESLGKLDEDE